MIEEHAFSELQLPHAREFLRLVEEVDSRFGVTLQHNSHSESGSYRKDAFVCVVWAPPGEQPTTNDVRHVREWIEGQDWHFSRQQGRHPFDPERSLERFHLAPRSFFEIRKGYHVTRESSVASIRETGLLPSIPERQTSNDRSDCEGNIYICEHLGKPEDAGVQGSLSAHWWCDHMSKNNRFGDPHWVILEVEIGLVEGAFLYDDLWSESGIVVGGVDSIPHHCIQKVYP